jgi:hypothetical protein
MSRDVFFRMLWTTPVKQLAVEFNVMPLDIRGLVELYELPLPGPVSWMTLPRKERLKHLPPLPPHSRPERLPAAWPLQKPGKDKIGRYGLFVPIALPRSLHPIAKVTNAALTKVQLDKPVDCQVWGEGLFTCRTQASCRERAVAFINALLRVFEKLCFQVSAADDLEVECFGVWFRFDLRYRAIAESNQKHREPNVILYVVPLSPAYRGRQTGSFYGRGDKPLEACFNTLLIWLLRTASSVKDGEEAWSDARRAEEGTVEERFQRRRAARKAEAEKLQAEATRKAAIEAEHAQRDAEEARMREMEDLEAARRHAESQLPLEDLSAQAILDRIDKRVAACVRRDPRAVLSKQDAFLWIVQTVMVATAPQPDDVEDDEYFLKSTTMALLQEARAALSKSYIIPDNIGAGEAAEDFLSHYLPEGLAARTDPEYSAPDWMGELTSAELSALMARAKKTVVGDEIRYELGPLSADWLASRGHL